jgi:MFS superfamily sulfate permease-like transporter
MAGGVIALLRFAALNWVSQIYEKKEGEVKYIQLEGNLNYINCGDAEIKIFDHLAESDYKAYVIVLDDQGYIDPDGVDCLEKCFKKKKNTYLVTLQLENAETHAVLTRSHLYQSLKKDNRVFVSLENFKK